jgi:hypothetical protein
VYDARDIAERSSRLRERVNGLTFRDVHGRGARLESSASQYLGRCVAVSKQRVLARAYPSGDRLTDRPRWCLLAQR